MQPSGNDDPPQTPEFNRQLFTSLVQGTRQSNALPGEHEHAAYSASMAGLGDRLTTMMTGFMPPGDESEFDRVRNLTDRALEQVDQSLDAARGVGATEGTPVLQTPQPRGTPAIPGSALSAGGSVTKPQSRWAVEVGAGNSDEPFMPKLRVKPNARVPLELRLERAEEEADGDAPARRGPQTWYANPYAFEIGAFQPSEIQLTPGVERPLVPLEATNCTWVSTEAQLMELKAKLCAASEFAVDLEAHSYHSYRGFVCLMQISTRDADYLVDAIELRGSLSILNEAFTNPRITTVMHGADSDVLWLQRDFGLYVVALFDTGQAARVLQFSSYSLAYLLERYAGVAANKKFALADWRIRPLGDEMIRYAREDAHYLLHIYDKLKSELVRHQLCGIVWQRSADLSRQAYKVTPFDPDDHLLLYHSQLRRQSGAAPGASLSLTPAQLGVHRALYCWRDAVARADDESPTSLLPNHLLLKLAQHAPRDGAALLRAAGGELPHLLQEKADSLVAAVAAALKDTAADAADAADADAAPAAAAAAPPAPAAASPPAAAAAPPFSMHPMQPALPAAAPAAQAATPAKQAAPAPAAAAPPAAQPAAPPQGASSAPPSSQPPPPGAAAAGSSRVRCPPSPSRSPPLGVDQLYSAARWVSSDAPSLHAALVPGGRPRQAKISGGGGGGGGVWDAGCSSSSSEGDDADEARLAELRTAKAIQQDLMSGGPLMGFSTGGADGDEKDGADDEKAPGSALAEAAITAAAGAGNEHVVPRSLNEIYRLSNLNKRRGVAHTRRPSEEVGGDAAYSSEDDVRGGGGGGGADDDDGDGEEGEEGDAKRSKRGGGGGGGGDGGEAWVPPNLEDPEIFMRRIGWIHSDELPPPNVARPAEYQFGGAMPYQQHQSRDAMHQQHQQQQGFQQPQQQQYQQQQQQYQQQSAPPPQPPPPPQQQAPPPLPFQQQMMPPPPPSAVAIPKPGPQPSMAPPGAPPGHHQSRSKRGGQRGHKRSGYGEDGFDYAAAGAAAPFVYPGQGGGGGPAVGPRGYAHQHQRGGRPGRGPGGR